MLSALRCKIQSALIKRTRQVLRLLTPPPPFCGDLSFKELISEVIPSECMRFLSLRAFELSLSLVRISEEHIEWLISRENRA